jgi:hypothetical protein
MTADPIATLEDLERRARTIDSWTGKLLADLIAYLKTREEPARHKAVDGIEIGGPVYVACEMCRKDFRVLYATSPMKANTLLDSRMRGVL